MSVSVSLIVWEFVSDGGRRVLEEKSVKVDERDLHNLPFIGLDLGDELASMMMLGAVGLSRTEASKSKTE